MSMPRHITIAAVALALAAGCGKTGPKQFDLAGKATVNGRPIPAGVIHFDPDIANGHDGPQGFARIVNGEFDTAKGGRGVVPGSHIVRVQGFDGIPANELPLGNRLFPDDERPMDLQPGVVVEIDVSTKKQ
jgi:hypothetical protein